MFCYKCGKNTESESHICPECLAAELEANAQAAPVNADEPTEEIQTPAAETASQPAQPTQQPTPQYAQQPAPQYVQAPMYYTPAPQYNQGYAYQPMAATNAAPSRMAGFGRALTSAIMGFVGYIWSLVSLGFATSGFHSELIAGFILAIMGLPFGIVGLILGITSLKSAIAQKKQTQVTPIAPMILGIAGLAMAAITLLFTLIVYIVFMINVY